MSDGTPVTMQYTQGMVSDEYSTLIEDENFKGRAVSVDQSFSYGSGFGTVFSNGYSGSVNTSIFSTVSGGKFRALLLGDNGSSLKCFMQYADASGFTSMGGVGTCIHSDGRAIEMQW